MSQFQHSHEFPTSAANLFTYLDDSEKIRQWMIGVVEDRPTSEGPTRVGSTFECDIKEGRKVVTYQGEVMKFEQDKHMNVKLIGGCGKKPMTMYADYVLTELGPNRTRMDYTCTCQLPPGILYTLMSPLFKFMGKSMIKKFFRKLHELVETPGKQTATA